MHHARRSAPLLVLAAALCPLAVSACRRSSPASERNVASGAEVRTPNPDEGVDTLDSRRKAQMAAAGDIRAFHDFQFSDSLAASGITFVQHIVEDAGKHYKAVHYDHGTGIAVADVDGDGLYDIYFVNQVGGNELWKNLGGGKFRNITAEAGVGVAGRISVTASFADVDNDGDEDLFVTTVRGGNILFENDGRGHFRDISKEAGVDLAAHSSGAVFFDYDRDGLVDLLVCNVGRYTTDRKGPDGAFVGLEDAFFGHLHPDRFEHPTLYRNLGHNRFKDVTADVGLKPAGWGGDATAADVNGDGWPDLFILNMQGQQHYFENAGGRSFIDRTKQHFPRAPWGAMGVKFFDFDNDGRQDLLVTDMHSDMFEKLPPAREKEKGRVHPPAEGLGGNPDDFVFGNALFHNLGDGRYEEISDRVGAENYWPWGPSVGDVNADGWDDVFIASSMNYPHRYGINSLLLNDHGRRLADAEFVLGIEPRRDGRTHTPWFELDCLAEGLGTDLCRGQSGKITVMAPLGSRSAVIFDLDGDGDLDIVTNEFNSAPQVLISDLAARRSIHWTAIVLVGTTSNRDGLGATVRVRAGGHTYSKVNDGKSGYLSQSALPLYFGLGDADRIERIEVDWPSGKTQVETQGLDANRVLKMTEPR
ncbi:MAG TPA: CRTAC1 family protein [Vicinamibacterales bacterium]